MKSIKTYLSIVTILLISAIVAGIFVWYFIQRLDTTVSDIIIKTPTTTVEKQEILGTGMDATDKPLLGATTTSSATTPVPKKEPIVVDIATLSASQKKVLESLGYDSQGSFTITPAMIQCGEDAIGKERLTEILGGGTPSALESLKLIPCFKS